MTTIYLNRRLRIAVAIALVFICSFYLFLNGPAAWPAQALSGNTGIHDPSGIQIGSCYYVFGTGIGGVNNGNIRILKSCTGLYGSWAFLKTVFNTIPSWIVGVIGTTPGNLWAPDINLVNGQYRLYYAASTFGSNNSVIGLATATNIEGPWTDAGEVFRSTSSNNYNAIDPDYIEGKLSFGSFWDGIKMIDINTTTGKRSGTNVYNLASRGGGAIEASSIVHNGSFYYLFVSFDKCCAGVNSTYRTMVGRSSSLTGPYTDQNGVNMMNGGATQLLAANGNEIGPGGGDANSLLGYYVYHFYDRANNGASELNIRPITYTNGWPVLGAPVSSGPTPTPSGSSYYRITNRNSGKVVDVVGQSTSDGANVDQWTWSGGGNQQWQFNDLGNGYFTMVNQHSGKCLDVVSASKSSGANVDQWTCNGGSNQAWSWTAHGSYFQMKSQNSGLCLDVANSGTGDGVNIDQVTCNSAANQDWSRQ